MKTITVVLSILVVTCTNCLGEGVNIRLSLKATVPVKRLYSLSILPELKSLAIGESYRSFTLYNFENNEKKNPPVFNEEISSFAYLPRSGIFILGCRDNYLYLVDSTSLQVSKRIDMYRPVLQLFKLADDKVFVSTKDDNKGFLVINGKTGMIEKTIGDHGGEDHCYGAVSKEEDKLIAFGDIDKIVLWDFKTGKNLWSVTNKYGFTYSLAISSDSKVFAHGNGNGSISVRDVNTGNLLYSLEGHHNSVKGVRFIDNDRKLVSIEDDNDRYDNKGCSIRVWNLAERKTIYSIKDFCASFVDISSDERYLAVGGDEIRLYGIDRDGP